ncbi:MAG: hypothetical protein WCF23_02040 [Candidatus Nitrosopolaris sp.]
MLAAEDEELDSRIINFNATYSKDPMDVTGRGYLKDIIRRVVDLKERGKKEKDQLNEEEIQDEIDHIFNSILIAIGVAPGFLGMVTEAIMNEHRFVTLEENEEILYWNHGYEPEGEVIIKREMHKQFGYQIQIRHEREVINYIRKQTYHKKAEFDTDLDIINIGDGLYHISTDTLTDHDPDYLTMIQNTTILHSLKGEPKHYRKFLGDIFYPSDIQVAIDAQAYTFHRSNPFEIIIILLGNGLNGKSVFMAILRFAHGINNVSTVRFKKLADPEDRFSLALLEGKCFNYDGEMSKGFIEDVEDRLVLNRGFSCSLQITSSKASRI